MIYFVSFILGGLAGYLLALWQFNNSLPKDIPSIDLPLISHLINDINNDSKK